MPYEFQLIPTEEFTFHAVKVAKGSAFVKQYNVTRNGNPFAVVAKFTKSQGGNWYVGFAHSTNGGRYASFEAAQKAVLSH